MLFPGKMSTGVKFHMKNSTFYRGEKFSLLDFIFYIHSSGLNSREKGGGSLAACFQRLRTLKYFVKIVLFLCLGSHMHKYCEG